MQPRSHPEGNGTSPVSFDRRPATLQTDPPYPAAGGVSRLDRITLQLGVTVAVAIAICSYAVSATSLYALGVQAGYSWWQAAAVPVVADGPAIYGMFRSRQNDRDPVIWQPGQDYHMADALHAARTQRTRARHGPERVGPER
jgi:hypothetical protein